MAAPIDVAHRQLQAEAVCLAGGLTDLAQRATVYRHIFRTSGGNHVFPLIAAHGALWAGGYFRLGNWIARVLSWQYLFRSNVRRQQLARLAEFQDALRDINRRVCVDTYVNYHLTAQFDSDEEVGQYVPVSLLAVLRQIHAARRADRELTDVEKRDVFLAHFLHEQEHVVGPGVADAFAAFDWPLVRAIARRPLIRFAYLRGQHRLYFRNFATRDERISNGLRAFDLAADAGWPNVEAALENYAVLPRAAFAEPDGYFAAVRAAVM